MDSRFHGNDTTDLVIPTKVGIQFFATGQIGSLKTLLKLAHDGIVKNKMKNNHGDTKKLRVWSKRFHSI